MDMITKFQIEDAITNYEKVRSRVVEVAVKVVTIGGEISPDLGMPASWELTSFSFYNSPSSLENTCAARILVVLDQDEDRSFEDRKTISRVIRFPSRYLTTDGWEDEVAKKGRNRARWFARQRLEDAVKGLADREHALENYKKKLEEQRRLAAEDDE